MADKKKIKEIQKNLNEFRIRINNLKEDGFNFSNKLTDDINTLETKIKQTSILYKIWRKKITIISTIIIIIFLIILSNYYYTNMYIDENDTLIEISNLMNGDNVNNNITIKGSAYNPNKQILSVQIRIDNQNWINVEGTENWRYNWNTTQISNGSHIISIRSFDGSIYSTEENIIVIVNNSFPNQNKKPIVEIENPKENENVSDLISINGFILDEDTDNQNVELRIDNGSWSNLDGNDSWEYIWNTTLVINGNYLISVRTFDGTEYSEIKKLNVTVYNKPIVASLYFFDDFQNSNLGKWSIIRGIWGIDFKDENYFIHTNAYLIYRRYIISNETIPKDSIITAKIKSNSVTNQNSDASIGFFANKNGSCYFVNLKGEDDNLYINRWNEDKRENEELIVNYDIESKDNIWYNIKIMLHNNNIFVKRWETNENEPSDWQLFYYDVSPFGNHLLLGIMPGGKYEEAWYDDIIAGPIESHDSIDYSINPNADCLIKHDAPDANYGGSEFFEVRNDFGNNSDGRAWDALINFDISSIPSGANIISAKLKIYYYDYFTTDPKGRVLNLYRITSGWDEEIVTWNTQPSYDSSISSNSIVPRTFGWMTWDVTDDIQDYVDGTKTLFGWKVTDEEYWGTYDIPETVFYPKELNEINYWSKLEINIG